jgi:gluconokinase
MSEKQRSASKYWYLGVDLGTSSCKTVIIDDYADVLGFGASEYAASDTRTAWQEQDSKSILEGMIRAVRAALADAGDLSAPCAGLSLGGALHSMMALDDAGEPLTGVMTWADGRAVEQAQKLRGRAETADLYEQTGCPIHGMYPLYKIIWLREKRRDVFEQTARFVSAKEYIFAQMTGQYWIDPSLAAGSGLLNTHTLNWHAPALELAGIEPEQLSSLHPPTEAHQGLAPSLAARMGIPADTPVVLGSSDATNSNLGAGAVQPHQATLNVGSSGAYRFIAPKPILDPKARSWCYAIDENHWLVGGAINNAGLALSWWRDALNAIIPDDGQVSFSNLIEKAEEVQAGADGLLCLPFLAGERSPYWNLNARASFFGLTLEHDARHMARALLEGVGFSIRSLDEALVEQGAQIDEVRASGGFTKSDFWMEMISSALKRALTVPAWGETSSLGAAFWPLLAGGAVDNLEDLGDLVKLDRTCQPNQRDAAIYDQRYPFYRDLYTTLESSFDRIADLQRHSAKSS